MNWSVDISNRAPRALAAALLAMCIPALHGEIIDRIAVSVGNAVITQSEIEREIRITAFLNNEPLDFSAEARRKAAERLVEQKLVRREIELSRYPVPPASEAEPRFKELVARYPGEQAFRHALEQYGVTQQELRDHLLWQLTLLRFVDMRFRPGVQVSEQDVREYFEKKLTPASAASLDDVRETIEEVLIAERVDRDLDQWLAAARRRVGVEYRKDAFE